MATLLWLGGAWLLPPTPLLLATAIAIGLFTLVGTWATNALEPYWGEDPSRVVIDEMVGVWVPLLACPPGHWGYAAAAFLLFRFFDILKPLGIRALDRRHGGFWVMADDLLAGLYTLLILILVRWLA